MIWHYSWWSLTEAGRCTIAIVMLSFFPENVLPGAEERFYSSRDAATFLELYTISTQIYDNCLGNKNQTGWAVAGKQLRQAIIISGSVGECRWRQSLMWCRCQRSHRGLLMGRKFWNWQIRWTGDVFVRRIYQFDVIAGSRSEQQLQSIFVGRKTIASRSVASGVLISVQLAATWGHPFQGHSNTVLTPSLFRV